MPQGCTTASVKAPPASLVSVPSPRPDATRRHPQASWSTRTVSRFNIEEKVTQGPETLTDPLEIAGHLRTLATHKERVNLSFTELPVARHGYTSVLALDRERKLMALDGVGALGSDRL